MNVTCSSPTGYSDGSPKSHGAGLNARTVGCLHRWRVLAENQVMPTPVRKWPYRVPCAHFFASVEPGAGHGGGCSGASAPQFLRR